jgi:hypothetical protein
MDMHPVASAIASYTEGVSVTPPVALRALGHIDEHTKNGRRGRCREAHPHETYWAA